MGGKGRRRREKNYRESHGGGNTRLPPPPVPSSVDAIPSKLRKLMSFAGTVKRPIILAKKNQGNSVEKGIHSGEGTDSRSTGTKRKWNNSSLIHKNRKDNTLINQKMENGSNVTESSMLEKEKKKKKKKKTKTKANDLRFESVGATDTVVSQRKERKKQLLEARKKKNKRPRIEDTEFPGHEEIKFGDIVHAPPKLVVPKAFKPAHDASQERLRLQAIEAYRKRKGWTSRPGVQLPPPFTASSLV